MKISGLLAIVKINMYLQIKCYIGLFRNKIELQQNQKISLRKINQDVGDSLYVFTSSHDLQFIGIPFVIKYTMGKGKFNFNAFAGTSVNFLIRGKIETLVEKGADNETEVLNNLQGLKKIYFSGSAGIGTEYKLNKKIALTFSPTIRFALNSINKNAPVKSYPNSFGLSTGIKLGL